MQALASSGLRTDSSIAAAKAAVSMMLQETLKPGVSNVATALHTAQGAKSQRHSVGQKVRQALQVIGKLSCD